MAARGPRGNGLTRVMMKRKGEGEGGEGLTGGARRCGDDGGGGAGGEMEIPWVYRCPEI